MGKAVMIVEDNAADVSIVKEALAVQGLLEVDLQVFEDGEAAIDQLRLIEAGDVRDYPSLILLDVNLPRSDGFEVLRYLRSCDNCGRIPVILMTSSNAQADRAMAISLRADAYFVKPVSYDAFLKIGTLVREVLSGQG